MMQPEQRHYSVRELPWHAHQRLLAQQLPGRRRVTPGPLQRASWLARALAIPPARC